MQKEFGFAIVGTGNISRTHYEQISMIDGAKVVAVYSRNEEKVKTFADQIGTDWYTNYETMLERKDIDIVNILTPSGLHADMTIKAAQAGKHVIVEKPIDITLEKAQQMIEECRNNHVKLCVVSQHRFDPSSVKIKSAIESGEFGKVLLGQAAVNWYRPQSYYDSGKWRGTWELDGGGVLMNQAIHTIDLFQDFMGEVESVFAHTATLAHQRIEVEDVAVATVKFKHGGLGTIVGTTAAYPGLSARLEIFGSKGTAVIENDELVKYYLKTEDENAINLVETEKASNGTINNSPAIFNGTSFRLQFIDMIEAIKMDREPLVNGEEGLKPLKIILAIYESARIGKPVIVDNL